MPSSDPLAVLLALVLAVGRAVGDVGTGVALDPVPAGQASALVSPAVRTAIVSTAAVRAVAVSAAVDTVGTGSDAPWVWPTGGRVVERGWEAPADDHAAGHRGIDVDAAVGTLAVAVADGVVSFAGSVAGRGVVSIDHGDGLVSTLDSVTPLVAAGEVVRRGDPVGTVAAGHCSAEASCLHLGARVDGRYVDPTPYLPAAAWPVLLPESAWPG